MEAQISEDTIIGRGTRLNGEFNLDGLLRIDGDFSGTIRSRGKVLVGSNGRAECTIYAGRVVIGGVVRGNIISKEKVRILSTGMVLGNITTPRLIMEEGVIFNGNCRIVKANDPALEARNRTERSREQNIMLPSYMQGNNVGSMQPAPEADPLPVGK